MSTDSVIRDALVIGICQYDDLPMSDQLNTLAEQAEQLAQLLETQGGFKVRRLPCTPDGQIDMRPVIGRVTLPELEQAIEKLLYPPAESPTQTALLFFAGHGLVKETKLGKEGFLATSEADSRSVYGFSLKTLRDLLRNSPIKQQIVFLESCHSGEFFTHFQADEKRDYCFVTSARAHEEALAEGLLTKAVLDILDYTHQSKDTPWVNSDTLIENLQQQSITTDGWQRFEMQTQGHLMLTNYAFSQQVDPNAKPYKGLRYFDNKPEDALFFKGREKLIAELLTKVQEKSFLAILGASGNGKSSVVRAGVLYQLQQTERWQIIKPFTPTANPLTALTNGLGTTDVLTLVTSTKARVILTIDQFEEVFSLCQDGQARETFFNILLDAVEQATGKLCLIVVMRADFLDKCSNYPRLAGYFQDHQRIVTRPTEAEIQQIIESPAKQAGFLVEPRLVAEMITDFKDSLGGLPLLEFALTTLWEKGKADRLLRYADYQALGGIQGILEKKATETYEELTPAEQVVAKRIFLELTELGEGRHDTRRLVPQTDLLSFATRTASPSRTGSPEPSVEQVIAKLVKEHLIVTDKTEVTVVNIAHDALIENWSVLRKWLDQSREDLKLQRQINEGAKAWKEGKKALLVGVDLARAEEYLGTHLERVPLSEGGVEFVKASLQARQRQRRWKQAGIASLIAITLSLASYTYWYQYSYVWEHVTYCNQFVKRYGLPQCVGELTKEQVQRRAVSYRLLRKGSKNPVYKMQAVQGTNGQVAELTGRHTVGTYFIAGNSQSSPSQPSQWEFVLDKEGKIVYEKAFDSQDKLVWGLVYSPRLVGQQAHAHYVGVDGFPRPQSGGMAEFVEITYTASGDEQTIRYFDRQHQPQPGLGSVFVIQQEFDERGLTVTKAHFDAQEQPMSDEKGVYKLELHYDVRSNLIGAAFFDSEKQPILNKDGIHKWVSRYDEWDRRIEEVYFGTQGQRILRKDNGIHKIAFSYDERGNIHEQAFFDAKEQPMSDENGVHRWVSLYDSRGNMLEQAFFDTKGRPTLPRTEGFHKRVSLYNERGSILEVAFFDTKEQPILDRNGVHKVVWHYNERGNLFEQAFFDTEGQPALPHKEGFHKIVLLYDKQGNLIETTFLDTFGNTLKKLDSHGNQLEVALFDKTGTPIEKYGVHKEVSRYDKRGNLIEGSWFDAQGQPTLLENYVHKIVMRLDNKGVAIGITLLDTQGQLVDSFSADNVSGVLGMLEKLHHLRPLLEFFDKAVLNKPIVVFEIFPDSQAEKLGIQSGDVFVKYDGKPIKDTISFIANRDAEPIDGSAKELKVLRNGQELTFRVLPGKIGAGLRDIQGWMDPAVK